jgi:hypothetical protein
LLSQITISLSSTLNALKESINSDMTLGPIKREQQRLFYLGRELKSGNRTLSALGVGSHGVYSFHLLSCAPNVVDLVDMQEEERPSHASSGTTGVGKRSRGSPGRGDGDGGDIAPSVSGGNASNTSGGGGVGRESKSVGRRRQQRGGAREQVVELLDSDSSDVSDDDVVEIKDTPSIKKRRRT